MIYDDDFQYETTTNLASKKNIKLIKLKVLVPNLKFQDPKSRMLDAIQIKIKDIDPKSIDFVSNAEAIHQEINQHIRGLQDYDRVFFDGLIECRLNLFRQENIHKNINYQKSHSGAFSYISKMIGY